MLDISFGHIVLYCVQSAPQILGRNVNGFPVAFSFPCSAGERQQNCSHPWQQKAVSVVFLLSSSIFFPNGGGLILIQIFTVGLCHQWNWNENIKSVPYVDAFFILWNLYASG